MGVLHEEGESVLTDHIHILGVLFLGAFAIPSGQASRPTSGFDNDLQEAAATALKRVHQRALAECQRKADAIAQAFEAGEDPEPAYREFRELCTVMTTQLGEASKGVDSGALAQELQLLASLQKLRSTGFILSEVHRMKASHQRGLRNTCKRYQTQYDELTREMAAAAEGRGNTFTKKEASAFRERFDALEEAATDDVRRTALLVTRQIDRAHEAAVKAGPAGGTLKGAADKARQRFESDLLRLRTREYPHLFDWQTSSSAAYRAFLSHAKSADQRFAEARSRLLARVRELDLPALCERTQAEIEAVLKPARKEIEAPVIGVDNDDFIEHANQASKLAEATRAARQRILESHAARLRGAHEKMDALVAELLLLAPDEGARKELLKVREEAFEDVLDRHAVPLTAFLTADWKTRPEVAGLLRRAKVIGDFDHDLREFLLLVKQSNATLAVSGARTSLKSIDALPDYVSKFPGGLNHAYQMIKDYQFDKKYTEAVSRAKAVGFELGWTQWSRTQLGWEWAERVVKTASSEARIALTVARGLATAHDRIQNARNALNGRNEHLDEFIDDPDGFMATYVTEGMFDALDNLRFDSLEACRTSLTPKDWNEVLLQQIAATEKELKALLSGAKGEDAKVLKGAVQAYLNVVQGSYYRGSVSMDQVAEQMIRMATERKRERDSERNAWRRARDAELDALAARIARLTKDQSRCATALHQLERTLAGAGVSLGASRARYEAGQKEIGRALQELEQTIKRAEGN